LLRLLLCLMLHHLLRHLLHHLLQAACAPKELKELVNLPNIGVHAAPGQLAVSEQDKAEMKATRMKRRIFDLVSTVSQHPGQHGEAQHSHACPRSLPGCPMQLNVA
jgi:hypothetical protein